MALLLIDVINDLDFPEGDQLLAHALPMARQIAGLKRRARQRASRSSTSTTTSAAGGRTSTPRSNTACTTACAGRPIVELLRPDEDDYFVLKPKHSGFFSTTLDILLEYLEVEDGDPDGHGGEHLRAVHGQRRLHAGLPPRRCRRDCVASNTEEENRHALDQMRKVLKADTRPSTELSFQALARKDG